MKTFQWLLVFAGVWARCVGQSCVKEKRRLPSPSGLQGKVAPAKHYLHVRYHDWDTKTFEPIEANSSTFRAKAGLDPGSIIYGESYATGRRCNLKMIQLVKPTHSFEVPESGSLTRVWLELQLHHVCESQTFYDDQLSDDHDAIQDLKAKVSGFFAKLQRLAETSDADLSPTELEDQAARVKADIKDAREEIAEHEDAIDKTKQAKKLDDSWHRPHLPENVVIVAPLTFDESDVQQELNGFLQALLKSSGETARWSHPGTIVAQGGPALMYNGTSLEAPCDSTLEWFVLTGISALPTSDYDLLMRLLEDSTLFAGRDHTTTKKEADLALAEVDERYLAKPKYTPKEEGVRAPKFLFMIGGVITFGALWHAMNPDGEVTAMLFYGSIAILVLLATIGYAFIPGDLFTSEPFGFVRAIQALSFDHDLWNNICAFCAFLGVMLAVVILQVFLYNKFLWGHGPQCDDNWIFFLGFLDVLLVLFILLGPFMIPDVGPSWQNAWTLLQRAHISAWFLLLLASCLIPFLGVPISILPAMATSGASLLLGAVMLCLYKLPGLAGPFGSWWMSFVAGWPLASFLVRITWRGIPMLMTTLVAPWLTLPLGAFVHDKVNCIDGFDWEVHFAFAFVICMKSMFWLLFYQHEHSAFARVITYVFYIMAELDMYTDAMFIAIATTCGSWYGHAALLTYAGGVVALQLCIPTLFIGASQGHSGQVGAMWNLLLFPVESAPRKAERKGYLPLDQQFEINEGDAKRQVMVLAVLRCLGEDLPQCVLQYLFTINVKKNPLIMFSIGTSVCSSVFAVAKACYSYNS